MINDETIDYFFNTPQSQFIVLAQYGKDTHRIKYLKNLSIAAS